MSVAASPQLPRKEEGEKVAALALDWRERCVVPIPCHPDTKVPSVAWGKYQQSLPPRSLVRHWFSRPSNIALVTGGTGHLIVLDFDDPDRYDDWAKDAPDTRIVKTSRGAHAYFYSVKPSFSYRLDGLDVLADRSLVMAPPSIHPSGSRYEAVSDAKIALVRNVSDVVGCQLPPPPFSFTRQERRAQRASTTPVDVIKSSISLLSILKRYTVPFPSSQDGRWWVMSCPHPSHEDCNPSFWCDVGRGRCGCHVCRSGTMDVIDLFAWLNACSVQDAIKELRCLI